MKNTNWQLILIGSLIILGFSHCATTNKTKSITKTNIDSTSLVKVDSNVVKSVDSTSLKKDNTITTVEKEDNYTKETVFEFGIGGDTSSYKQEKGFYVKSADYFPPIKKITIKETGIKKEKQIIAANKVDSTVLKSNESTGLVKEENTQLHKTETVKNKDVKRTSYYGWLWLLLLIPAYLVYRNWGKIKLFLKIA